jgi:hypothetical protein
LVVMTAWPLEFTVAVPNTAVPTVNVTVPPVGVWPPAETVAVSVNVCPATAELAAGTKVVFVATAPTEAETVTAAALDVLELKPDAPPYEAVRSKLPSGKVVVTSVAIPELFKVPVPRTVLPLLNVTVPVAVPDEAATVAVNVSDPPTVIVPAAAASVVVVVAAVVDVTFTDVADDVLLALKPVPPP